MLKYLLAGASLLFLSPTAHALPISGMNSFETHCESFYDIQVDPIGQYGVSPSMHMHTFYGFYPTADLDAKAIGDLPQSDAQVGFIQLPNGNTSTIRDPGYTPLTGSCPFYGEWSSYWIPTPKSNGEYGVNYRNSWQTASPPAGYIWLKPSEYPRTVYEATFTWAAPAGVHVIEPPYGMSVKIGNAHAMSEADQDNLHVYWTCGDLTTKSSAPRDCSGGAGTIDYTAMKGLVADYNTKSTAAQAQMAAINSAIAANDTNALTAAINSLKPLVAAMQTDASQMVAPAPSGGGVAATPNEYGNTGVVTGVVVFPNCWDQQAAYPNFDIPTGISQSHFSYAVNNVCPAGSVMITQLFMSNHFGDLDTGGVMTNPFNKDGTYKLSFASGPYYTYHADFWNGWNVNLGYFTSAFLNKDLRYGNSGIVLQGSDFIKGIARCPAPTEQSLVDLGWPAHGINVCKDQD